MLVIPDRTAVGHGAPLGIHFNHIEEVGPDGGLWIETCYKAYGTLNPKSLNPKPTPLRTPSSSVAPPSATIRAKVAERKAPTCTALNLRRPTFPE